MIILNKFFNRFKFYFFIIFTLLIFYLPLVSKYDFVFNDLGYYFVPNFQFINDELRSGRIPLWFGYYNFGTPQIFKLDLGFFNPVLFFYYLLNYFININNSFYVTHEIREYFAIIILILSSFSFFYSTKKLNIFKNDETIIFLGSIAYSISAFESSLVVNGLIFIALPLITYCLINSAKIGRFEIKNLLLLIFLNYFVFSIGLPNFYLYIAVYQSLLVLIVNKKIFLRFLLVYLISFGVSSFILFPNFYILATSGRSLSIVNHSEFSLKPYKIFELLNTDLGIQRIFGIKDFFIHPLFSFGTILCPFLILGLYSFLKNKEANWIIYILFIFFIYSTGDTFGLVTFLSNYIPFIDLVRSHYNGIVILNFLFCLLIIEGLNKSINYKNILEKINYGLIIFTALIIFLIQLSNLENKLDNLNSWIFVSIQLIIIFISLKYLHNNKFLTLSIILFFIFLTNSNILTKNNNRQTSSKVFYQKDSFIKNLSKESNYKTDFRISHNLNYFNPYVSQSIGYHGYDSLIPISFIKFRDNFKNLSNTGIKYIYTSEEIDKNSKEVTLLEKVNNLERTFSGISKYKDIYLYQVNNPLQNYFSPTYLDICESNFCISEGDSRNKVRYNGKDRLENQSKNYTIDIIDNNSNTVRLKINSDSRRFIASRENMQKGWSLLVNGKSENLYYVDEGFRGFFVEKGESLVEMKYQPPFLIEGLIVSCVSILLLVIFIIFL